MDMIGRIFEHEGAPRPRMVLLLQATDAVPLLVRVLICCKQNPEFFHTFFLERGVWNPVTLTDPLRKGWCLKCLVLSPRSAARNIANLSGHIVGMLTASR